MCENKPVEGTKWRSLTSLVWLQVLSADYCLEDLFQNFVQCIFNTFIQYIYLGCAELSGYSPAPTHKSLFWLRSERSCCQSCLDLQSFTVISDQADSSSSPAHCGGSRGQRRAGNKDQTKRGAAGVDVRTETGSDCKMEGKRVTADARKTRTASSLIRFPPTSTTCWQPAQTVLWPCGSFHVNMGFQVD